MPIYFTTQRCAQLLAIIEMIILTHTSRFLFLQIHPSKTQEKLVADSHERGIEVMAYSPFGFYVSRGSHNNPVKNDRTVADIARKYNKTVNQVLVRYLVSWIFVLQYLIMDR